MFGIETLSGTAGALATVGAVLVEALALPVLETASLALILGAALLVSGAVVVSGVRELRADRQDGSVAA